MRNKMPMVSTAMYQGSINVQANKSFDLAIVAHVYVWIYASRTTSFR